MAALMEVSMFIILKMCVYACTCVGFFPPTHNPKGDPKSVKLQ